MTNKVLFIEYLREYTTIPLPCLRRWGLTEESPQQLGPVIIMNFINGIHLSTFLKEPTEDDQADLISNPAIEASLFLGLSFPISAPSLESTLQKHKLSLRGLSHIA